MANSNSYVDIDPGDIASARQDILSAYIPQPPPPPQAEPEHPVVSFARSLMFPSEPDSPPSGAQLGMTAREAADELPNMTGPVHGVVQMFANTVNPLINDIAGKSADLRSFLGGPHSDYFNSPEAASNAESLFGLTRAGSGGVADIHVPGAAVAGVKAAGSAAADELAAQAAKIPGPESSFLAGEAGAARIPKKATPEDIAKASADFNKAAESVQVGGNAAAPKFGDAGTSFENIDPGQLTKAIQATTPYNSITEFGKAVRSGEAAANGAPQGLIDQFLKGEVEMGLRARGVAPDVIALAQRAAGAPEARSAAEQQIENDARIAGGNLRGPVTSTGPLGKRIASRTDEVAPSAEANEALATANGKTFAPGTGGALTELPPEVPPTSPLLREAATSADGEAAVQHANLVVSQLKQAHGFLFQPEIGGVAPRSGVQEAGPFFGSYDAASRAAADDAASGLARLKFKGVGNMFDAPKTGTDTLLPNRVLQSTIQRKFTARTVVDVWNSALYNGLVAPTTNLVHSFGSTAMALAHFPENLLDSAVDKGLSLAGVTKNRNFTVEQSIAGLQAQIQGTGAALVHDLPQTILHGPTSLIDADVPAEVNSALLRGEYGSNVLLKTLGAAGKVASIGDYPLRAITAVDQTMRLGLQRSYLVEQGFREGMAQKLAGDDLHTFVAHYVNDAGADLLKKADDAARGQINRSTPGSIAGAVLKSRNALGPAGTVILPFFNTHLNILKTTATWSPLGFARLLPKEVPVLGYFGRNTLTEADRVQAFTRAGVGSLMLKPIWDNVLADNITGDGPTDPKAKAQWVGDPNNPSHVARAIRTPMGWVTYAKVPVIGGYLAAVADTAQAIRDGKDPDMSPAQAAAAGLVQFFAHEGDGLETAAQTLQALGGWMKNPNDPQSQSELARQLASRGFELTPWSGAIRADATINDPNYKSIPRGTKGIFDQAGQLYRANFPQNFPLGNTAEMPNGAPRIPGLSGGVGGLLPVHVTPDDAAPITGTAAGLPPLVQTEADRLAKNVTTFKGLSLPTNRLGGTTLNSMTLNGAQYLDFSRYVGEARNTAIADLMLKPVYQNASDSVKALMFKSTLTAADKKGEQEYLKNGVLTSTDPQQIKTEAVLLMKQGNEIDKTKWAYAMAQSGKLTPQVKAAIDASRPQPLPGQKQQPAIDEYVRAAPLVSKYLSIPPYLQGTPQEWAALKEAKSRLTAAENAVKQTQNLPSSAVTQVAMSKLAPQDQQLIQKYPPALTNPARRYFLNQNQWIEQFLGSATATTQP